MTLAVVLREGIINVVLMFASQSLFFAFCLFKKRKQSTLQNGVHVYVCIRRGRDPSVWISGRGGVENAFVRLLHAFLTLILRSAGEQSRNNKRFTSLAVGFQLIASETHVGKGGKWEMGNPQQASCK